MDHILHVFHLVMMLLLFISVFWCKATLPLYLTLFRGYVDLPPRCQLFPHVLQLHILFCRCLSNVDCALELLVLLHLTKTSKIDPFYKFYILFLPTVCF